jgi:hypothetical protein
VWRCVVLGVTAEFKCNRCGDGQSLVGGVCKSYATGNKCASTLPYGVYCARVRPQA